MDESFARRAGRTAPELVDITGLSKARVDEAIAGQGDTTALEYGDASLRIAAYEAAGAVAAYLACRARRDALMLEAGASGLGFGEVARLAGTSRRYEWQLRSGQLSPDRRSPRQDVFEGAGMDAYRAAENLRLRRRRVPEQTGEL